LTPRQGDQLADWIVDLDRHHNAPTPERVRQMTESILRSKNILRTIGKKWHIGFIQRNQKVQSLIGKPQRSMRIEQATEEVVRGWFDMFSHEMKRFQVQPLNIHNIDEHGIGLGICKSHQVLGEQEKIERGRPQEYSNSRVGVSC
jgi:hypothetical protein